MFRMIESFEVTPEMLKSAIHAMKEAVTDLCPIDPSVDNKLIMEDSRLADMDTFEYGFITGALWAQTQLKKN